MKLGLFDIISYFPQPNIAIFWATSKKIASFLLDDSELGDCILVTREAEQILDFLLWGLGLGYCEAIAVDFVVNTCKKDNQGVLNHLEGYRLNSLVQRKLNLLN